jgi:hypothetical protein
LPAAVQRRYSGHIAGDQRSARQVVDLLLGAPIMTPEAARVLIAEAGISLVTTYHSADAFTRAMSAAPGNIKSAGKVLNAATLGGNVHVVLALNQAAAAWLRQVHEPHTEG